VNRLLLRAPKSLRRRPSRARRVVIAHAPLEYSPERTVPRWLIVLASVLGAVAVAELVIAVVMTA